jgi:hypothetical protein
MWWNALIAAECTDKKEVTFDAIKKVASSVI